MANSKKGFTIIELILAVIIMALLMTALGFVFRGTVNTYTVNQNMLESYNDSRMAIKRISDEIRNAVTVSTSEPQNQCSIIRADGEDITYRYDADAKEILYCTNGDLTDQDYVICDNIESAVFQKVTASYADGTQYVKEVVVTISSKNGSVTQNMTSSVAVRKNL